MGDVLEPAAHEALYRDDGVRRVERLVGLRVVANNDPALGQVKAITVSGGTLVDQVDISKVDGDVDHLRFIDQVIVPLTLTAEESALLDAAAQ